MSEEKRFVEDHSYLVQYHNCIFDKVQHKHLYLDEVIDLLNEQDRKIDVLKNSWEIMNQRLYEKNKCDYKKAIIEYKKAIIEFCKFMNINTPLLDVMVDEFLQEVF